MNSHIEQLIMETEELQSASAALFLCLELRLTLTVSAREVRVDSATGHHWTLPFDPDEHQPIDEVCAAVAAVARMLTKA